MTIYLILIFFWGLVYLTLEHSIKDNDLLKRKIAAWLMGVSLFLLMALKHKSVGVDTDQYLFRYNYVIYPLNLSIFKLDEWTFHGFASILKQVGISDQGYLAMYALIISIIFSRFFYKYSSNLFLSFFLHLTIGLFTMSMSGMRQMLAISIILIAFNYIVEKKLVNFVFCIYLATNIHSSAIVFLPLYLLRNISINKFRGLVFFYITLSFLFFRKLLVPFFEILSPERFLDRYQLVSETNSVNPLLVVISLAIPLACIILWKYKLWNELMLGRIMSLVFMMSLLNAFFNILSLNSNMIGRLSYYFIPFNMIILPHVITNIKNKNFRSIAYFLCIILPLIQFIMSTPGGTLRIDDYKFFWN